MTDGPYRSKTRTHVRLEFENASGWVEDLGEIEAFLREIGTSEEIESRMQVLLQVNRTLHQTALGAEDEARVQDAISTLGHHLERLKEKAESVEGRAKVRGWRFDRKKGKKGGLVTLPTPGVKGNNPLRHFSTKVSELYDDWLPEGRQNNQSIREQIADALAFEFPPSVLDPSKDGPIGNAIKGHLRKSRPPVKK